MSKLIHFILEEKYEKRDLNASANQQDKGPDTYLVPFIKMPTFEKLFSGEYVG